MRAYSVRRIADSSAAKPWTGQNEMPRVRLWRARERQSSQTNRGTGGGRGALPGSTTKVISAYRGVNRPSPMPFQTAGVWTRFEGGKGLAALAFEPVPVWVL